MKQNVGGYDRIARLVLGVVLVAAGAVGYAGVLDLAVLGIPALAVEVAAVLVGLALLVTGWLRSDPVTAALGIDTASGDVTTGEGGEETPGAERPRAN